MFGLYSTFMSRSWVCWLINELLETDWLTVGRMDDVEMAAQMICLCMVVWDLAGVSLCDTVCHFMACSLVGFIAGSLDYVNVRSYVTLAFPAPCRFQGSMSSGDCSVKSSVCYGQAVAVPSVC